MTLKANFTIKDVRNFVQTKIANYEKAVINAYQFAGEEFVKAARIKTAAEGGFNDVTGNLRSSIGYIIIKNGKQLSENFQEADNGSDRATGTVTGLRYALEVAEGFRKGIVLILVAGMDYAAAVEAKNKDVITGSAEAIENRLKQLLQNIR